MDRQRHNHLKLLFIERWVRCGQKVLDVGCGFGGDFHKWQKVGATYIGVDPSEESLREARRRFKSASLLHGTLFDVPRGLRFHVLCFNFSLQYCKPVLKETFERAHELLSDRGTIIGVVPDSEKILLGLDPCYTVSPNSDQVTVFIPGTPYYESKGPVPEPLIGRRDIQQSIGQMFEIIEWSDFNGVYSKFILRKIQDGDRVSSHSNHTMDTVHTV